jgi:hypothetical protein
MPLARAGFLAAISAGCGQTLDAGRDTQHGSLPVDERNPVILINDGWSDNWSGEYALLFANHGGSRVAGIIANRSTYWPKLEENVAGWKNLVAAARSAGFKNIPDVTDSPSVPLVESADQSIDSTAANGSKGANLILDVSRQLSLPWRPVVVLACSGLTDVADAYLMDPTVVTRVVVVSLIGEYSAPNGLMTGPNGDQDPWADWIVAQRFSYVQVTARYDQSVDVTTADFPRLPDNSFGQWMRAKQPKLLTRTTAADQLAVLAAGLRNFAVTVRSASADPSWESTPIPGQGPPLLPDANGNVALVTEINPRLARDQLWKMLQ